MIPLTNNSSSTTQSLVITLGGAATTTYPTVTVSSYIIPRQAKTVAMAVGQFVADPGEYQSANERTLLTSASETTIAAAPNTQQVKNIFHLSVYNADTVATKVTLAIDDNGTNRNLITCTLQTGETLFYENHEGFYAIDANGNRKVATTAVNSSAILGTTTNDNAAAGRLGEYTQSVVNSGSAISLTTATSTDVTSISLTAGDWDVYGNVSFLADTTTSVTVGTASINTTSATIDAKSFARYQTSAFVPGAITVWTLVPNSKRISINTTTTVYLIALGIFTVSTLSAYGILQARRMR